MDILGRSGLEMNILVTGSSGFVGRNLLPLLHKDSWRVWHLVRNPKGLDNEIIWDFKSELPKGIPELNMIVHLAANVHLGPDLDPEQYAVNTVATEMLANLAKRNKAFLIFASSAAVNGDTVSVGRSVPLNPLSHYAMTKVLAEAVIRQQTEDYIFLRIGGIYGLDGPEHLGLNRSISQAYHSQTVPRLKGDGAARRNYICVDDVARWIEELIRQRVLGAASREKILYLGGPEILTIREYLVAVARAFTGSEQPVFEEGPSAKDFVLEADLPNFKMTKFDEYLALLSTRRKKHAYCGWFTVS